MKIALLQGKKKGNVYLYYIKSSDIDAVQEVAKYLIDNDIDVYLDKLDTGLQKATRENDAQGIVDSINRALMCSTDILVLVSN